MKIRLSFLALACALIAAPIHVQASDEPETELTKKMDKMSSAFRTLRRQVKDPEKNASSLEKLAILRENAEASAKLEPAKKEAIPAAEQAKFVADYQAQMKEFIALLGKLETALKANDNETATKLVADLGKAQKQGHTDFQKKKKKT